MSLLSICQDILNETKSSSIPVVIIGNNDDVAKQILQAVKNSITELSRGYQWQELQKEYTFTSVISQANYSLPSDFDRLVNDTFWNQDQHRALIGATTAEIWRILKDSATLGVGDEEFYRIRNNEIVIHQTPTAIQNYVFEYITKNIVKSSTNTPQTGFLADTDIPVIDEYIVKLDTTWRWLKNNGRAYAEEKITAEKAIAERIKVNGSRGKINAPLKDVWNVQISTIRPINYAS